MKDYEKILSIFIDITKLLNDNNCTYSETDEILNLAISEINAQREDIEYGTIDNWLKNNKISCADNLIVRPLNQWTV